MSLRDQYENESLEVIKNRVHKELMFMDNDDLHLFIQLQRESSEKSKDSKTTSLNMLSLIDKVYKDKQKNIKASPPTVPPVPAAQPETEPDDEPAEEERPASPQRKVGHYLLLKTLGQGTFAKVKLAENTITKEKVAVKVIDKKNIKGNKQMVSMKREIHLMKFLNHPHIVRALDVFETEKEFFIVMEFAAGGELFDYIVKRGKLPEDEARRIFRQIISAVDYCHQNSVIHRDLKPENLLFDSQMNIKIIDFGFGNTFHREQLLNTFCGSPFYAAPEMIKGVQYIGPEVDVWSMGVILYAMLTANLPFDAKTLNELYDLINSGKYPQPKGVSPSVEDLIARMLTINPAKRITIQQLKQHPWVNIGYHSVPSNYLPKRPSVVRNPNPDSIAVLRSVGFSEVEVTKTIRRDVGLHPIVCLYHLAEEARLQKLNEEERKKNEQLEQTTLGLGQLALERAPSKKLSRVEQAEQKQAETPKDPPKRKASKKFFLFNTEPKEKNEPIIYQEPVQDNALPMDIDTVLELPSKALENVSANSLELSPKQKDIRGFFNITTTTNQDLNSVKREIERVLNLHNLEIQILENNRYLASSRNKNSYVFEIHIVTIDDAENQLAIQFKRVKGSLWYHKKYAGRLIQDMHL